MEEYLMEEYLPELIKLIRSTIIDKGEREFDNCTVKAYRVGSNLIRIDIKEK